MQITVTSADGDAVGQVEVQPQQTPLAVAAQLAQQVQSSESFTSSRTLRQCGDSHYLSVCTQFGIPPAVQLLLFNGTPIGPNQSVRAADARRRRRDGVMLVIVLITCMYATDGAQFAAAGVGADDLLVIMRNPSAAASAPPAASGSSSLLPLAPTAGFAVRAGMKLHEIPVRGDE